MIVSPQPWDLTGNFPKRTADNRRVKSRNKHRTLKKLTLEQGLIQLQIPQRMSSPKIGTVVI